MKKIFITIISFMAVIAVSAQQVKEEIKQNMYLSASNYLAYPGPTQEKLTPAPKGYKPFYISHYGRHGSRYLMGDDDYNKALDVLSEADEQGKLTHFGKDVLHRVKLIHDEANNRHGELTQLGAEQHRQIAQRMFERFPEVFKGNANIDAKSTVVIRCILSMENELLQFISMNPKLNIRHDASEHDMYYMNYSDKPLWAKRMTQRVKTLYEEFCKRHVKYERAMGQLFNDKDYMKYDVDAEDLNNRLFKLASNLQSTELRKEITLYDIFNEDEIYGNWQASNAWWFTGFGFYTVNDATQPFVQRNLLRNIITEADSCIATGKPGATLRFGHEGMVMGLACLTGMNGYDVAVDDFEQLEEKGWINYKIFPMGSNIQFVFYRKNANDNDVIFKALLNENEVALPIATDNAPYYKWSDFKDYCLKKLESYKE